MNFDCRCFAVLVCGVFVGCGPRIDVGSPAAERWSQTVPVHHLPTTTDRVTLLALQEGGYGFDPAGREGLAWTVAHARWRGGAAPWSAEQVGWAPYTEGMELTIDVGARYIQTALTCPEATAASCLALWTSAFANPTFDRDGVAATELRRRRHVALHAEDPLLAASLLGRRAIQGVHPRGQAAPGRTESLLGVPVASLAARRRQIDTRGNLSFAVVGGTEERVAELERFQHSLPVGPPLDDAAPPPDPIAARVVIAEVPGPDGAVGLVGRTAGSNVEQHLTQQALRALVHGLLGADARSSGTAEGDVGVVMPIAATDAAAAVIALGRLAEHARSGTLPTSTLDAAVARVIAPVDPVERAFESRWSQELESRRNILDASTMRALLAQTTDWKVVVAGPQADTLRSAWAEGPRLEETLRSIVQAGELADALGRDGWSVDEDDLLVAEDWTR